MAATLDTLRLSRRFREAGVPESQAEVFADALREVQEAGLAQLATKTEFQGGLEALRLSTKAEIEALRLATKAEIDALRLATKGDLERTELALRKDLAALEARIAEAKYDLLKWVVPLLAAQLLGLVGLYFR